jgi:hypothetical protein
VASAALYSASLRRAAAAATATKSSTSPEATASLSCLQWKISSCSTHSAPHVRRHRAARSSPPRVPELQPEMQSTGIETHIHHQNVQASQKKIRQDTRYARCGAAVALLLLLRALGDYKKRWRYVGLLYRFIYIYCIGVKLIKAFIFFLSA